MKRAHRQPLKGLANAIRRHAFFKVRFSTHALVVCIYMYMYMWYAYNYEASPPAAAQGPDERHPTARILQGALIYTLLWHAYVCGGGGGYKGKTFTYC